MAFAFLKQLRITNVARWAVWSGSTEPDPLYQSNEFGGEAGEVQNVVKKLVREARGWKGSRSSVDKLADEIADCIICLDSLANSYGIDLADAIVRKFNATSEANGFEHRLTIDGEPSDDMIVHVARSIAKADKVDFDAPCLHEDDPEADDYCEREDCPAHMWEDHDADSARTHYRKYARAAIEAGVAA